METYAQVLNYAIPLFVTLIIIEHLISIKIGMKVNRGADMISSLSSGNTNAIKDVLGLSIVIVGYGWLVEKVALFELEMSVTAVVIAFVAKDFAGYWMHRWSHRINFLWNRHVIHHSSEEFNLSCALRQTVSQFFSIFGLLMLPAALLGVPAKVVAIVAPLHLFAQFWYHTRLINKMGIFEYFLVTPSHHRVHHAMNNEYLDRNFSQVFIVWDKIFGTFQPELANIPPVYGVKKQPNTWNPILINFQHFWIMFKDAWHTESWKEKFLLWFKPTGYRPADVAEKYPIDIVKDMSTFEKYTTNLSPTLLGWSWFQMTVTFALMFYMFNNIVEIGLPGIFIYGAFLMICIYSYTTLMDKSKYSVVAELIKVIFGLSLIWWQGNDWFGLAAISPAWIYGLALYFIVSLMATFYFLKSEPEVEKVGSWA